jgi:hypothetical protein
VSDLFVGLVTHPRSRFNADGAATRQAEQLVSAFIPQGVRASLLVSDRDDYDPTTYPLGRRELVSSAIHQAGLEHRWRRYLAAGGGQPARPAFMDAGFGAAMAAKRAATSGALMPGSAVMNGRRAATRLINIDLSHLRVLDAGVTSGAPWVLVLEDDARVDDLALAASRVVEIMRFVQRAPVQFVCLSESIGLGELGVDGLLSAAPSGPDWLLPASRPITNTVCANLYRSSFAARVAAGIRDRGLLPVTPIDWRLNEQVMDMHDDGELGPDSCLWARPGLFLQGSMHSESP